MGSGGVAAVALGYHRPFPYLDRPSEPNSPSDCPSTQSSPGSVGPLSRALQFPHHLPARLQEPQGGRSLSAFLAGDKPSGASDHPTGPTLLGPPPMASGTIHLGCSPADPASPETPPNRLYVPTACRLMWGHCSQLAGHQGQAHTLQLLRRALWWPSMRKDVREFTAACDVCARSKSSTQPGTGDLQTLPVPKRPWSHIGLDFVMGLPAVDHLNTILTITDRFSKAVHLVALAGLPTVKRTAELLLEQVVWLHGFPQDVVSDRGPQFILRFWRAFCCLVGASTSLSSRYHPQTNGQTERANQQLGRYLRCFASSQPSTWPRYPLWAELSHNLQTSSATGLSPFETCYGCQPPLFGHQIPEVEVPAAQTLVRRCWFAWIRAHAAITRTNTEYSRQHHSRHRPGPVFRSGDQVWLSSANLRMPAGSRKLAPRFLGPFLGPFPVIMLRLLQRSFYWSQQNLPLTPSSHPKCSSQTPNQIQQMSSHHPSFTVPPLAPGRI
uniref:Gypsy retrotransposon integrase-like protein 1 n=1 Tax=Nothobranchius furzeri TaxID=105023 RepID=A0A8C6LLE9_NOTFU